MNNPQRTRLLSGIALLFHLVGLGLLLRGRADLFLFSTRYHLLLMAILLVIAYRGQIQRFAAWATPVAFLSFAIEWIGVHTGTLFGSYYYGPILSPLADGVPLLIALNWIVVMAGAASLGAYVFKSPAPGIATGALLATAYDVLLEPVAMHWGWWQWTTGAVPLFNYGSWAAFSAIFITFYRMAGLRPNGFAVVLFCTGTAFFLFLQLFFIP